MVASTGCVMNLLYHINYVNSMRKKILLYVSINAKLKACWENAEIFNNLALVYRPYVSTVEFDIRKFELRAGGFISNYFEQ